MQKELPVGCMEDLAWKVLEHLHDWQRAHLPGCESPHGNEILIWLLKCGTSPRPLKDLYRSSRYSEPTVRTSLKAFVEAGLVELQVGGGDMRNRYARVTPRFEALVAAYRQRFGEAAALLEMIERGDVAAANLFTEEATAG